MTLILFIFFAGWWVTWIWWY